MQATPALDRRPEVVNIVKQDIADRPRAFVVPPQLGIGKPARVSQVRWTNGTGRRAWLWFPNGDRVFTPREGGYLNPIEIPSDGLNLDVQTDPLEGAYHYHVYCEAVHDCAQGNSEPRLSVP